MEVLILFSYFPLVNTPKVKAIKGISFCKIELPNWFLFGLSSPVSGIWSKSKSQKAVNLAQAIGHFSATRSEKQEEEGDSSAAGDFLCVMSNIKPLLIKQSTYDLGYYFSDTSKELMPFST